MYENTRDLLIANHIDIYCLYRWNSFGDIRLSIITSLEELMSGFVDGVTAESISLEKIFEGDYVQCRTVKELLIGSDR